MTIVFFFCHLYYFNSYQISFGEIYAFNERGTIKANFTFGLGLTTIKESQNWILNANAYGTYYSWDNEK